MERGREPETEMSGIWTGTREEQRQIWLHNWPQVQPNVLETLVDDKPRFSTLDVHTSMALRLILASTLAKGKNEPLYEPLYTLLFAAAKGHMDVARYIERCNHDNAKYADDLETGEELIMSASADDMAVLGLPVEVSDILVEEPLDEPPTTATEAASFNPFNREENAEVLWISSSETRLKAWMTKWPESMADAVEHLVDEDDHQLQVVDSHAYACLRLMKLRDLVVGREIKDLLANLALIHLKIVAYCHSSMEEGVSGPLPEAPGNRHPGFLF